MRPTWLALDEVGRQQALLQLELPPVRLREVQQLVRLERLGVLQRVEVVVETGASRRRP